MNIKALQQAALAFIFTAGFAVSASAADTILFDPDGTGAVGSYSVGSFDWLVSSSLSVGAIENGQPTSSTFTTYAHAALGGVTDSGGNALALPGLNTGAYEITFIAGFTETITSVSNSALTCMSGTCAADATSSTYFFTQTIQLAEAGSGTNFFKMYYDDFSSGSLSNALAGTGFGDGKEILTATVGDVNGNFTSLFTWVDGNGDQIIDAGEIQTVKLDGFGPDDWPGQLTITGVGSTDLEGDVTFQDYDFFKDNISALLVDMFFNTSNNLPFLQTNPSKSFNDGDDGTFGSILPVGTLGINGLTGPNFMFQTDSNSSFLVTRAVPEPNSILLIALGLLFMGGVAARKSRVLPA